MTIAAAATRDLVYGAGLGLDLYLPAGATPAPLVVFLHGGGGTSGDKAQGRGRAEALAARGLAVACVQYRVDGRPGLDHQREHLSLALAWLREHGVEHGVAGDRVVLWGVSSGGHLASLAALAAPDPGIAAVITWYAATDLPAIAARSPLEARLLPPSPVERLLPGRAGDPDALVEASPAFAVTAGAPPFLIGHGDRDQMVPEYHARALHDALVRHGVPSTLLTLGGAGHDDPRFFEDPVVLDLVAAFARRHLDGAPLSAA